MAMSVRRESAALLNPVFCIDWSVNEPVANQRPAATEGRERSEGSTQRVIFPLEARSKKYCPSEAIEESSTMQTVSIPRSKQASTI
jgi:hypothetical protein